MTEHIAPIPLQWIGPITLLGPEITGDVEVPLATFESPLWPSTNRGAAICNKAGGITVVLTKECMTRSVLVEAPSASEALQAHHGLLLEKDKLKEISEKTSRYLSFIDLHIEQVGTLLYIRFEMQTGNASGHNMVTKAADELLKWICLRYPFLSYVSISANICTDKKASAINGILGRGKCVIAEVVLPHKLVQRYLKTTPKQIVELNIKKNLIGSILSGGIRTANAHFANILLALYLATGQDAANIVEGSQGIVYAELRDEALYFSVTLPNIIVGTVGNGKHLDFVRENLLRMSCTSARQLAAIIGATVLCGELSLLAAQTNQGELMATHLELERKG